MDNERDKAWDAAVVNGCLKAWFHLKTSYLEILKLSGCCNLVRYNHCQYQTSLSKPPKERERKPSHPLFFLMSLTWITYILDQNLGIQNHPYDKHAEMPMLWNVWGRIYFERLKDNATLNNNKAGSMLHHLCKFIDSSSFRQNYITKNQSLNNLAIKVRDSLPYLKPF